MNILIIRDNKPGHYNQSEGIAFSIKKAYPTTTIKYLDIQSTISFTRKPLRWLLNMFPSFFSSQLSLMFLPMFYLLKLNIEVPPTLIISTGGNTAPLNAWLSKIYNCKNILNGRLRGLKEKHFTAITTIIDLGYKNQIILDVAPSTITSHSIQQAATDFKEQHTLEAGPYYSLLIGGNGAGYNYGLDFYKNLAQFVKKTALQDKIKWLISTSRRTPIDIEKMLHDELSAFCAYFVPFNQSSERCVHAFLGLSEKVFVTEESSSMISEAISAKKEVFTFSLKNNKADNNYRTILNKFKQEKKLIQITDGKFDNISNFYFPPKDYSDILASQLLSILKDGA